MRIYDPRAGRFLSVDPITSQYPWYTPYQFAGNKPIWAVDLDGLEEYYAADGAFIGKSGKSTEIRVISNKETIKIAKNNLKHKNWYHDWLKEWSAVAYKSELSKDAGENEFGFFLSKAETQLYHDWGVENRPKIKDVEFTMSLFKKTLTDKYGKSLNHLKC